MFFHIVIVFLGFREVLGKQEVYRGTFPIPLKTNLMGYWFERITFCACLIRIIPYHNYEPYMPSVCMAISDGKHMMHELAGALLP